MRRLFSRDRHDRHDLPSPHSPPASSSADPSPPPSSSALSLSGSPPDPPPSSPALPSPGLSSSRPSSSHSPSLPPPPSQGPVITYHITLSLSGTLSAVPSPPVADGFAIEIAKSAEGGWIDRGLDISVATASTGAPAGRCRVSTMLTPRRGGPGGGVLANGTPISFEQLRGGAGASGGYGIVLGQNDIRLEWVPDTDAVAFFGHEGERRWKCVEAGSSSVVARLAAGNHNTATHFGTIEIYTDRAVTPAAGGADGVDWATLLVMSSVAASMREDRRAEKKKKAMTAIQLLMTLNGLGGLP